MNSELKEELKNKLSSLEYAVCVEKSTEPPFSGKYYLEKSSGEYLCKCCKSSLFKSEWKFDSGCGWPSFYDAIKDSVEFIEDLSHNMRRVEVVCNNCKAHLGHIFPDGPAPTYERYCINSVSVDFKEVK